MLLYVLLGGLVSALILLFVFFPWKDPELKAERAAWKRAQEESKRRREEETRLREGPDDVGGAARRAERFLHPDSPEQGDTTILTEGLPEDK